MCVRALSTLRVLQTTEQKRRRQGQRPPRVLTLPWPAAQCSAVAPFRVAASTGTPHVPTSSASTSRRSCGCDGGGGGGGGGAGGGGGGDDDDGDGDGQNAAA